MSRIGNKNITLNTTTFVKVKEGRINIKGTYGNLSFLIPSRINVKLAENLIIIKTEKKSNKLKELCGTTRSIINNMVIGVTKRFYKKLKLSGVGFKVKIIFSKFVVLNLGINNEIYYPIPNNINFVCQNRDTLTVVGTDKQLVGQISAEIKSLKYPEPYNGKGIRYDNEYIIRKAGKKKK